MPPLAKSSKRETEADRWTPQGSGKSDGTSIQVLSKQRPRQSAEDVQDAVVDDLSSAPSPGYVGAAVELALGGEALPVGGHLARKFVHCAFLPSAANIDAWLHSPNAASDAG